MATPSIVKKKDWIINQEGLNKLLLVIGDNSKDAETKYEEIRKKIINYLRFHGSPTPEEHADKVIDVVARKLSKDKLNLDSNYIRYFFTVAKNFLRDYWKSPEYKKQSLNNLLSFQKPFVNPVEIEKEEYERLLKERQLECLRTCLNSLSPKDSQLIKKYYQVKKRSRENLANKFDFTIETLRVKIFRLKGKLEKCINKCVGEIKM